ncbi:hypothetical protein GOC91_28865 [Sinorhizobium medicae]|nr:hypothetical protein [Sinorhizobium medicae]MDX0882824.1 hypothetical protein [Sinorhizobium medicae]
MIGVLAHEVGHLINDHRRDDGLSSWHKEYEADFFVGRAVAILGGSVEDAMLAVSQQPEDASTGYPSRALRQAAVSEGFLKTRTGSTAAAEPPSDLWEPLDIKVTPDSTSVKFEVENQEFVTNIADFQHGAAIRRPDDVRTQARSASVRLGRAKDMAMISAFRRERDQVCVKHLFLSIRDGENISIEPVRSRWGQGDYYGITYGRRRDLFNVVGIRAADFEFVFDPTEPRLGSSRNPIAKVIDSIAAGTSGISVVEGGCRMS